MFPDNYFQWWETCRRDTAREFIFPSDWMAWFLTCPAVFNDEDGVSRVAGGVTCGECPPDCESVFDRVVVSHLSRGGTRVMWELLDSFVDPMPYEFTLQVGQTLGLDSNDWEDVGVPFRDLYCAIDSTQRNYAKLNRTHYRVKLRTIKGTYYSLPVGMTGTLGQRDWRLAKEMLRQEMVRFRLHAGQRGYLLKRRISGEPCPTCLDYQTNEIRDPNCPDCWGTGFKCGYFFPVSCVYADIDPKAYHVELKADRGTVNEVVVRARMLNTYFLSEEDIWVNATTDDRYYIHSVQNVAEMRGVSLIAKVEMRPAPATDVAYSIEIPEQVEALECL